jgi:hypothetical protein
MICKHCNCYIDDVFITTKVEVKTCPECGKDTTTQQPLSERDVVPIPLSERIVPHLITEQSAEIQAEIAALETGLREARSALETYSPDFDWLTEKLRNLIGETII